MQGDLFASAGLATSPAAELMLDTDQLQAWQQRLHGHQASLFRGDPERTSQTTLFGDSRSDAVRAIDPLALTPLPLTFWRWPDSPHAGAAMYFVLDRPADLEQPLLLYIGETMAADRRWKGEHDCKTYLAAYGEALSSAGLHSQPSIRFWIDVPQTTKARRQLEQELIQTWLPPFNKETRERWATPFNAD